VGLAVRFMELIGLWVQVRKLKEESPEYRAFERARRG
jgi:hypothetical protein